MTRKIARKIILIGLSMMLTTSCGKPNVLSEFAQKDSDEAMFIEAKKKIDDADWSSAISIITTDLSTSFQTRTEVREALMGAYAGKCGLNFVNLFKGFENMSATDSLFVLIMKPFSGVIVDTASCELSLAVLQQLGATPATRTADQNIFATLLGFAKMGTYLHNRFDLELSRAGNGSVDAGWDSCIASVAPGADTKLLDTEVDGVILGLGLMFENLDALVTALGSNAGVDSLSDAKTACEAALGGAPGACTITNPASITSSMRKMFRRMISSQSFGFGTCDITDLITPSCCPTIGY